MILLPGNNQTYFYDFNLNKFLIEEVCSRTNLIVAICLTLQ